MDFDHRAVVVQLSLGPVCILTVLDVPSVYSGECGGVRGGVMLEVVRTVTVQEERLILGIV
jgi:hypothetical protein